MPSLLHTEPILIGQDLICLYLWFCRFKNRDADSTLDRWAAVRLFQSVDLSSRVATIAELCSFAVSPIAEKRESVIASSAASGIASMVSSWLYAPVVIWPITRCVFQSTPVVWAQSESYVLIWMREDYFVYSGTNRLQFLGQWACRC